MVATRDQAGIKGPAVTTFGSTTTTTTKTMAATYTGVVAAGSVQILFMTGIRNPFGLMGGNSRR